MQAIASQVTQSYQSQIDETREQLERDLKQVLARVDRITRDINLEFEHKFRHLHTKIDSLKTQDNPIAQF